MILQDMDEALDIKPTVTIEGKQLELLKIESAAVGQTYQICAVAKISGISMNKLENGEDDNRITFELDSIEMEQPEAETNLSSMYPNSPAQS